MPVMSIRNSFLSQSTIMKIHVNRAFKTQQQNLFSTINFWYAGMEFVTSFHLVKQICKNNLNPLQILTPARGKGLNSPAPHPVKSLEYFRKLWSIMSVQHPLKDGLNPMITSSPQVISRQTQIWI